MMGTQNVNPFGTNWPLAPAVIGYIANRFAVSQQEACLKLQGKLRDGSIVAQGPLKSANAVVIEREFWRYALPDPEGQASNLSTFASLPWFELSAHDVLGQWPPESVSNAGCKGAPSKLIFYVLQDAFELECKKNGSTPPDKEGPKGWRRQADVVRWILSWAEDRGEGISESTAKTYARNLIQKNRPESHS
jgi:hypothetical protein